MRSWARSAGHRSNMLHARVRHHHPQVHRIVDLVDSGRTLAENGLVERLAQEGPNSPADLLLTADAGRLEHLFGVFGIGGYQLVKPRLSAEAEEKHALRRRSGDIEAGRKTSKTGAARR